MSPAGSAAVTFVGGRGVPRRMVLAETERAAAHLTGAGFRLRSLGACLAGGDGPGMGPPRRG